jgi:hypothetical protein
MLRQVNYFIMQITISNLPSATITIAINVTVQDALTSIYDGTSRLRVSIVLPPI